MSVWGSFSDYLLSRPLRLRKRAARLLLNDYFSQPSVSLFPKLDLIKLRKLVLLFTILNNPDASLCLKRIFNFCLPFVQLICAPELAVLIFKFPSRGLILESAHLLTLLPPFLNTDLKQITSVSLSSTIFSSRLYNFSDKLLILLLESASNVSHLKELMCYDLSLFSLL